MRYVAFLTQYLCNVESDFLYTAEVSEGHEHADVPATIGLEWSDDSMVCGGTHRQMSLVSGGQPSESPIPVDARTGDVFAIMKVADAAKKIRKSAA
ncbi:hypothetical protein BK022_09915 [Methylorubrum extorquens]|uniref:Uncharacterized protein n=1 Tax=Methylorubrum extorquens TaxID=408 RepID=A0A1S1P1E1_METEX|nr:hypothetical protein BK022_09915 [Methylorubrum extorquens]